MGRGRGRGGQGWRTSLVVCSDPKSAEKKAKELVTFFDKRKTTLKKKARELATLCAVPVAVVAALPGGSGPDVWESQEGVVLARYLELPADKRAEHTHERYLEDQLGKVTAKLARMRQSGPPALAPPDSTLSKMTLEELRVLLDSIDAALLATAERKKALGLPDEDEEVEPRGHGVSCIGGEYQIQPPTNAVINESHHNQATLDAFPSCNNERQMIPAADDYYTDINMVQPHPYSHDHQSEIQPAGYYADTVQPCPYNNDHQMTPAGYYDDYYTDVVQPHPCNHDQQMIPATETQPAGYYDDYYYTDTMQQPPCNAQHIGGNYTLQNKVPGNGNSHHGLLGSDASFQPLNATMLPTDVSSFGMEDYQMPTYGNEFGDDGYPLPYPESWRTAGLHNDVIKSAEHPYMGMSNNRVCMPAPYPYAPRVDGGNFTNPPAAAFWYMGTDGNVANMDGREMQSSSNEYQYSDNTSQNSSSNEETRCPSDVAAARR